MVNEERNELDCTLTWEKWPILWTVCVCVGDHAQLCDWAPQLHRPHTAHAGTGRHAGVLPREMDFTPHREYRSSFTTVLTGGTHKWRVGTGLVRRISHSMNERQKNYYLWVNDIRLQKLAWKEGNAMHTVCGICCVWYTTVCAIVYYPTICYLSHDLSCNMVTVCQWALIIAEIHYRSKVWWW